MSFQQAVWLSLEGASSASSTQRINTYFQPLAREEALIARAEAFAQSTRSLHIALCEASPPARAHLPVNLDPLNLARFNGRWDARCTPAAATNYLLEQIDT